MKILDVSTAAVVGIISMAAVIAWSPTPYAAASRVYSRELQLRDSLREIVLDRGLVWIQDASISSVCGWLSALSNSTVTFSASDSGVVCAIGPPPGYIYANLTAPFPTRTVVFEAWSDAGR